MVCTTISVLVRMCAYVLSVHVCSSSRLCMSFLSFYVRPSLYQSGSLFFKAVPPCGHLYVNMYLCGSLDACLSECRPVCRVVVGLSAPSVSLTTFGLPAV